MPTSLTTRLTELLDLTIPIMSAPMAGIASGDLAAAVSRAGGLGLIGGGYGDRQWLARELDIAVDAGWRSPKVRRSSLRKDRRPLDDC